MNIEAVAIECSLPSRLKVLVSDNASTDHTWEMLSRFRTNAFDLVSFRQKRNVGLDLNCLFLTQQVETDWFWWFGDDDLIKPGAISRVMEVLRADEPDVLIFSFDQPPHTNGNWVFQYGSNTYFPDSCKEMCHVLNRYTKLSAYVIRNSSIPFNDAVFHYANAYGWFWLGYCYAVLEYSRLPRLAVISEPLAGCDPEWLGVQSDKEAMEAALRWDISLCAQQQWRMQQHPFARRNAPELLSLGKRQAKRCLIREWYRASIGLARNPSERGHPYLEKPTLAVEWLSFSPKQMGWLIVILYRGSRLRQWLEGREQPVQHSRLTDAYGATRAALIAKDLASPVAPASSSVAMHSAPHAGAGIPNLELVRPGEILDDASTREDALLNALRCRPISRLVRTLYQIGAHRFQEKKLLFDIFPHLERVVLFEPLPELFVHLQKQEQGDSRVTVLPYAISERDGEATFHVASNDGASSSILPFGRLKDLFPHVQTVRQIQVQTRTLATVIGEHQLPPPDLLFLDVQGAEYQILATLSQELLHRVRMIYTEASTIEVYAGSKPLTELERILAADFNFAGFIPLKEHIPSHGNALFVNKSQAWLLLPEPPTTTDADRGAAAQQQLWARMLRGILPRKLRRSIRKRLATLAQGLAN